MASNGNGNGAARSTTRIPAKTIDDLLELVREGCPVKPACAKVGIHHSTFYAWLNEGRDHRLAKEQGKRLTVRQEQLASFAERADLAETASEAVLFERFLVEAKKDRGKGNWLPWLKVLALRFPERWAERRAHDDQDAPDEYDLSNLTTEQLRALRDLLREARLHGDARDEEKSHLRAV